MGTVDEIEVFKALSVPSRVKILLLLKGEGPLPVKTLAERLEMTTPAVSQHLKALRYAGLVRSERRGYFVPYEVNPRALADCAGAVLRICSCDEGSCRTQPHEGETSKKLAALVEKRRALHAELRQVEEAIAREEEKDT